MRILAQVIVLVFLPFFLQAQELPADVALALRTSSNDSVKYFASESAAYYFVESNRDSLLHYVNLCITLAQKNGKKLEEGWGLASRGYCLTGSGQFSQAFESFLKAFEIEEDPDNEVRTWLPAGQTGRQRRLYFLSYTHHIYGILMTATRNHEQAIHHFGEAKRIASEINVIRGVIWADMNLGFNYVALGKPDSALLFSKNAKDLAVKTPGEKKYLGTINSTLAQIALMKGDTAHAKQFYHEAIRDAVTYQNPLVLISVYQILSKLFHVEHVKDSSLWYARKAAETAKTVGENVTTAVDAAGIYENLYLGYQINNQSDSALKYAGLAIVAKSNLAKQEIKSLAEFQKMSLNEQLRLQALEREKVIYQNKVRTNFMLAGIGVLLLLAIIFYRNNAQKQKAKVKIEKAYNELKGTQQQLIQSEKMASLGELTAGIAHEIQNPLNFVNNFSEVNVELLEDLKNELASGNKQSAEEIADTLKENEIKINHHGKRADGIVKSMLQHSRTSSGQKELTDINQLCDEYLRLAYHGFRAKDKSSSASPMNIGIKTNFDSTIPKLSVVPQDIGRVILNLINNAFYAVRESAVAKAMADKEYEPTVLVTTKKLHDKVEIRVQDNGRGIAPSLIGKIFQPFFTTKPAGQGTGLGLSLAFDIITKGHGGELKVESVEGQKCEFIIRLPL